MSSEQASVKFTSKYRLLFWSVIALFLLSLAVTWQLSSKRDAIGFPVNLISYPLAGYNLLTKLNAQEQQAVEKVMARYLDESFWDLSLTEIQSGLLRLDWVVSAQVSRGWPDLLNIKLEKQVAIARWGENGLINQSGEVFYPTSIEEMTDLVLLDGNLDSAVLVAQRFSHVNTLFARQGIALASLRLLENQVWELGIYKGPKVVFSELEWRAQIERFLLSLPLLKAEIRNSALYYDLRYSNGLVVKQMK